MIKHIIVLTLCMTSLTLSAAQRSKSRSSTPSQLRQSLATISEVSEVTAPMPAQAATPHTVLSVVDDQIVLVCYPVEICCCLCGIFSLGAQLLVSRQQYTSERPHAE